MKEFERGLNKGLEIANTMLPFKVFQYLPAIEGISPVYDVIGTFRSRELAEDFIKYLAASSSFIYHESKYEIEEFKK